MPYSRGLLIPYRFGWAPKPSDHQTFLTLSFNIMMAPPQSPPLGLPLNHTWGSKSWPSQRSASTSSPTTSTSLTLERTKTARTNTKCKSSASRAPQPRRERRGGSLNMCHQVREQQDLGQAMSVPSLRQSRPLITFTTRAFQHPEADRQEPKCQRAEQTRSLLVHHRCRRATLSAWHLNQPLLLHRHQRAPAQHRAAAHRERSDVEWR